jgi:dolichol-phosphate mannosyltransferase
MLLQLPSFDGMHRFLPALVQIAGGEMRFVGVNVRPRRDGRSNYGNLGRAARGVIDLGGVLWLKSRSLARAVRAAKEEP